MNKSQTMTEPTDDELDAVIAEYRTRIYPQDMHPRFERAIMRAAIAKWGTPPAVAGEPVAWLDPWTGAKVTTDYDAYGKHGIPLYTAPQPTPSPTPQPTKAQAGTVPLTDEQIRAMCKESWVFETVKQWVRITEQHHGIKGDQHGAE